MSQSYHGLIHHVGSPPVIAVLSHGGAWQSDKPGIYFGNFALFWKPHFGPKRDEVTGKLRKLLHE